MIDIFRGSSSSQKFNLVSDDAFTPASFVITGCLAHDTDGRSREELRAPELLVRWGESWDVRMVVRDQEFPIKPSIPVESSSKAAAPWLTLSLPDGLPRAVMRELGNSRDTQAEDIGEQDRCPDLDILVIAKPWHEPFAHRALIHPGRRTICISVAGEHGGQYYDGPLIHVRPDGDVASLIPSGGHATLRIPSMIVAGSRGIPWDEALALEKMDDDKVHRCLLARMDAYLGPLGDQPLSFELGRPSARAAGLLVLLRQARPEAAIHVHVSTEALGAQRGPWRRLGQNIGVDLLDGTTGKKTSPSAPHLSLPTHLIDDPWVLPLIRAINRISDVIPRSLIP
jgi:hypothetical protein